MMTMELVPNLYALQFSKKYKVMLLLFDSLQNPQNVITICDYLSIPDILSLGGSCHNLRKIIKNQAIQLRIIKAKLHCYQKMPPPPTISSTQIMKNLILGQWVKNIPFYERPYQTQDKQQNKKGTNTIQLELLQSLFLIKATNRDKKTSKIRDIKKNKTDEPNNPLKTNQSSQKNNSKKKQQEKVLQNKHQETKIPKILSVKQKKEIVMKKFQEKGIPITQIQTVTKKQSDNLQNQIKKKFESFFGINRVKI